MAPLFRIIVGLSLASVSLAATPPCAQVREYIAALNQTTGRPHVPAQLAYDCLNSIPFHPKEAVELIDSIKPYFRLQSTIPWLANPPQEYVEKVQPATDIWARLEEVRTKAAAGSYKSEREFGAELTDIPHQAHDDHFFYIADSMAAVNYWGRPVALVSVSSDGQELPQQYVYEDIVQELLGNNLTWKPSHIIHINGQDALEFLEIEAQKGSHQDRDALWNDMFYSLPALSVKTESRGRFANPTWNYPGPFTNLTFANGTSRSYENFADIYVSFDGINDGEDLFNAYMSPNSSHYDGVLTDYVFNDTQPAPIPAPGYPPPVFRSYGNEIGGYHLEEDYSDIAVLSVTAFWKKTRKNNWSGLAAKFVADAKKAGKKKIIIDFSANGGGSLIRAYDLYKIFFPNTTDHAAATRYVVTEYTKIITEKYSDFSDKLPREYNASNDTLTTLQDEISVVCFNYGFNLDVNDKPFQHWEQQIGPAETSGVNFTNLLHRNLNNSVILANNGGDGIHGYGPLANYTETAFAPEDIIIVTDGTCTSACAVTVDLFRQRAGVKTIVIGGRPQKGIAQAIGGVRGSLFFQYSDLQLDAKTAIYNLSSSPEEAARLNQTELKEYWSSMPMYRSEDGNGGGVNFENAYRDGDTSGIPLQFFYEPAECRMLYTKQMAVDMTAMWKAVADTAWRGKNHCIAGNVTLGSSVHKRDLSDSEKSHTEQVGAWRASLRTSDYPVDVTVGGSRRSSKWH